MCACKKQIFVLLQTLFPAYQRVKGRKPVPGTRSRAGWEWRPWGAQAGPSPCHIAFCFLLTRINKLIISVLVIMGCPLLPTSPYEPVTFVIFMGTLCGALMQRVLGDALCKDSRNVKPSFSCLCLLFLELMYFFLLCLLMYFPLCFFLLCIFSSFPPAVFSFSI